MEKNENNKGVNIKVTDYGSKNGAKIDFYSKNPKEPDHKSVHIKVDYENKSYTTVDNANGSKETSSGKCYLTSACMKHYFSGFNDNCYELRVLRWFRDNFVSKADIEHYYQIAPSIVSEIESDENQDLIYNYIYDNVVNYCVKAIENGDYINAYTRYRDSILNLEETFVKKPLQNSLIKALKKITLSN